jgi:hypothetical protein
MKIEKFSSPLSWNRAEFIKRGEEIPEKLLVDTLHTEGELMTEEEMEDWICDTAKTFGVIRDHNETRFELLYAEFAEDLKYLIFLGKISEKEASGLLNKDLYTI